MYINDMRSSPRIQLDPREVMQLNNMIWMICQSPSSTYLPYVSADLDPVLVGLKGLEMDLFAIKMLDESIALLVGFITT